MQTTDFENSKIKLMLDVLFGRLKLRRKEMLLNPDCKIRRGRFYESLDIYTRYIECFEIELTAKEKKDFERVE